MKTHSSGGVAFFIRAATGNLIQFKFISSKYLFLVLLAVISFQHRLIAQKSAATFNQQSTIVSPELEQNLRSTLKKNSLKFQLVENNGQTGLPREVFAYFSTQNQTVFIEKDRLRIVVLDPVEDEKKPDVDTKDRNNRPVTTPRRFDYNAFSIRFNGSTGFKSWEKQNKFATKRNFMNLRQGNTDVIRAESYGEVILKNIYQGIDLRLYSQENGHLEFDWIVWPGADASAIRMEFEGQKKLGISADGGLKVGLGMGEFNMRLPESYYVTPAGKKAVDAKFCLYW